MLTAYLISHLLPHGTADILPHTHSALFRTAVSSVTEHLAASRRIVRLIELNLYQVRERFHHVKSANPSSSDRVAEMPNHPAGGCNSGSCEVVDDHNCMSPAISRVHDATDRIRVFLALRSRTRAPLGRKPPKVEVNSLRCADHDSTGPCSLACTFNNGRRWKKRLGAAAKRKVRAKYESVYDSAASVVIPATRRGLPPPLQSPCRCFSRSSFSLERQIAPGPT